MPPHQPTNQPTNPPTLADDYISLRITVGHDRIRDVVDTVLFGVDKYIVYPHLGSMGKNPHVHICIPGTYTSKDVERYRKRCYKFARGAGKLMAKTLSNGIAGFVSYVKHEAGTPILQGFEKDWFDSVSAYEKKGIGGYMDKKESKAPKNPDVFKQITYTNMERLCLRYRGENGIQSTQLEDTLEHMHKNGYRLQVTVLKNGIPRSYFEQFTAACKGDSIWSSNRFNRMSRDEPWRTSY